MENVLNITNGDSAVEIMKKAAIPGIFLPWQDLLHEGPVPKALSLEKLSQVRAEFITSRGWGTANYVKQNFIERDNILKSFGEYDKVILWFEHDLYDQLQILQVLDILNENTEIEKNITLICTDKYLGMLSPDEMKRQFKFEEPITQKHLLLASKAWAAFRSSSPEEWRELLDTDITVLPFLEGAIIRLLEDYPNVFNGLSRTAQQALTIISEGETHPGKVFGRNQEFEDRIFLGDSSFWVILQELLDSNPPLLELSHGKILTLPINKHQKLNITSVGMDVISGKRNWLDIKDINYWVGGVHLKPGNIWCWDSDSGSISKRD